MVEDKNEGPRSLGELLGLSSRGPVGQIVDATYQEEQRAFCRTSARALSGKDNGSKYGSNTSGWWGE